MLYETLVILGPTASGKTELGVRLARLVGGEILSADSRQVYRGLDIGTGKDLGLYSEEEPPVAHHLIDVVEPETEFSVFDYQRLFYTEHRDVRSRGRIPIVVGGTGLYLEAVLLKYPFVAVPKNDLLRRKLDPLPVEELTARLRSLRPKLHNTTDLTDRERLIRAIEIAEFSKKHPPPPLPDLRAFVLGTRWERTTLRDRISSRLETRLAGGLIEEVGKLAAGGLSWERLERLGLEYRFVADYLRGRIHNRNDLYLKLRSAIIRFAKRQETWFRRMERRGVRIHWIHENSLEESLQLLREHWPAISGFRS